MNRFLLSLLLLSSWLLSPIQAQQPENKRIVTFDWFANSDSSSPFRKKDNLVLIIMPAQSNEGTVDDAGTQETGSVPFANLPSHLTTAPSNIYYIQKSGGGTLTLAQWSVPNSLEWGWLNQTLYVLSGSWDEILFGKESLGGSMILPSNGGNYPRADARAVANATIAAANTRYGEGNYNVVYVCGIGETNSLNASDATNWNPAMVEFVDNDLRVNYVNAPIVVIKKGRWQTVDFPFIVSNLWPAQDAYVALNPSNNFIVSGLIPNGGGGWELQDQTVGDYSHYNAAGAMTMGNPVADEILRLFGGTKTDFTKPTITSAVVENANPDRIVITFSENLNTGIIPFWQEVTTSPSRNMVSSSISASTVTFTMSEPFYQGQTITTSYNKKQYYENCIQDLNGNEADNFTGQSVTNNVSTAVPTYTNVYTSNFSVDVNGWAGSSGGVVTRLASWEGESNVLEISGTDTTPLVFRGSVFVSGQRYRVRFKCYVGSGILSNGSVSEPYSLFVRALSQDISGNIYNYTRRSLLGSQWVDYEFTFTSTQTQLRVEGGFTIGEKVYFKNFVVDRIN
jgi:hypothetical protein